MAQPHGNDLLADLESRMRELKEESVEIERRMEELRARMSGINDDTTLLLGADIKDFDAPQP